MATIQLKAVSFQYQSGSNDSWMTLGKGTKAQILLLINCSWCFRNELDISELSSGCNWVHWIKCSLLFTSFHCCTLFFAVSYISLSKTPHLSLYTPTYIKIIPQCLSASEDFHIQLICSPWFSLSLISQGSSQTTSITLCLPIFCSLWGSQSLPLVPSWL